MGGIARRSHPVGTVKSAGCFTLAPSGPFLHKDLPKGWCDMQLWNDYEGRTIAEAYPLNKLIFDLRHQQPLRIQLLKDPKSVAQNYGLGPEEMARIDTLADESIDVFRSLKNHPLVDVGAHPLGLLMCLVVVQAEGRRLKREQQQTVTK